jgi:hypothetical protein
MADVIVDESRCHARHELYMHSHHASMTAGMMAVKWSSTAGGAGENHDLKERAAFLGMDRRASADIAGRR